MGTIIHDNVVYGGGGGVPIDDSTTAADKSWSSQKTASALSTVFKEFEYDSYETENRWLEFGSTGYPMTFYVNADNLTYMELSQKYSGVFIFLHRFISEQHFVKFIYQAEEPTEDLLLGKFFITTAYPTPYLTSVIGTSSAGMDVGIYGNNMIFSKNSADMSYFGGTFTMHGVFVYYIPSTRKLKIYITPKSIGDVNYLMDRTTISYSATRDGVTYPPYDGFCCLGVLK